MMTIRADYWEIIQEWMDSDVPIIKIVRSRYANLEEYRVKSIANQINAVISKNNFSQNTRNSMQAQKLLTQQERRQFLADLARVDPREALQTHPHLVQSYKLTRRTLEDGTVEDRVELKLPDKLGALRLDAQLAGELAGEMQHGSAVDTLLMGLMGLRPALPEGQPEPALWD